MGSEIDVYIGQTCLEKPSEKTKAYGIECTFVCNAHRLEADGSAVSISRGPCRLWPFYSHLFHCLP